jgi:hypothetical protein
MARFLSNGEARILLGPVTPARRNSSVILRLSPSFVKSTLGLRLAIFRMFNFSIYTPIARYGLYEPAKCMTPLVESLTM